MTIIRRFSKKRAEILALLETSQEALSAAEIHSALPHLDLATIYRNLELFVTDKVARKLHLTDTGEACYEVASELHHHAICTDCAEVLHFTAKNDVLIHALNIPDFDIDEIEVTVRGRHRRQHKKSI